MSPVDPGSLPGHWSGKYANNKTFKISVSNVTGFRAKVQYQSDGTNKFQEVLIKDKVVPDRRHQIHADQQWDSRDQERRH